MRKIQIILFTVILSGCETLGNYASREELSKINRAAVVSVVGSKISYNYVGLTIFNNKDSLYDLDGWDIDKYILDSVPEKLKEVNPKIEYLPILVDHEFIKSAYKNADLMHSLNELVILSKLREMGRKQGFSHAIVASRDSMQLDDTTVEVNGLGLRKIIGKARIGSFVLIKFQLFDLTTGQELSMMRVFQKDRESDFVWLKPYSQNSPATKDKFIQYAKASIDRWLPAVTKSLVTAEEDFN